ncbi:VOC family protein [Actinocorallia longicatena]|uniref:VOC family protein n=1 Tax=Actinocorallia longicatena TaxID=111803 RepID=A0ABP6QLS9_9ACTN
MAAIAHIRTTVLDCPDPRGLAAFYRNLVDGEIIADDGEWVVLSDQGRHRIAFQRTPDYLPPRWPDPAHPQQLHLDFTVDDLDEAERLTLAIGATKTAHQPDDGKSFRVFLDPAGHPFCLCVGPPEGLRPLA